MAEKLTYEKVLEMFAETDKRLDKRFAETDAFLKEKFEKTDKKIAENARHIGGIGRNNGFFAEEQYINALKDAPCLGEQRFAKCAANVNLVDKDKSTIGEIDILLESPDKIGIVEIKYRVESGDVGDLKGKTLKNYLKIYPEDKTKEIYLAIGGGSFDKDALAYAKKYGVGILKLQSSAIFDKSGVLKNYGAPVPKKTLGKTAKKAPAKRTTKKK